jgi:Luciferase-like monooxygenase
MAGAARVGEVRVGAVFRCSLEPELLRSYARGVEEFGYDELWIVEDCFYAGGIASAATALAATERITVGLGILPAVLRNPAATAMELAALARLHPGRVVPGLGHGVAAGCGRSAPCRPPSSPRSARRSAPSAPYWPARRSLRTAPTSTWTRCAWTTHPAARRRSWRACAGHGRCGCRAASPTARS